MIEEILALGLDRVELGYDLRPELIAGVKAMVDSGAIRVGSVHNFCPIPVGAPRPHPELYTPASTDRREREYAVTHISRTLRFAAEVGATVVVCHSGNVDMPRFSFELVRMASKNEQFGEPYEALKLKAQIVRDKKAPRQIEVSGREPSTARARRPGDRRPSRAGKPAHLGGHSVRTGGRAAHEAVLRLRHPPVVGYRPRPDPRKPRLHQRLALAAPLGPPHRRHAHPRRGPSRPRPHHAPARPGGF